MDATEIIQIKILVINSNIDDLEFLTEILSNSQYFIETDMKGISVLRRAIQMSPDLILLAPVISDIDGYEICRTLKTSPKTQHIPVIFTDTPDTQLDHIKAFRVGGCDFITQPMVAKEILARIDKQLNTCELTEQCQNHARLNNFPHTFTPGLVAILSHEYRNELEKILSSLDLLEHYGKYTTKDEKASYFLNIRSSIERMTEWLNQLILLEKAKNQKPSWKSNRVDLVRYCKDLVNEYQPTLQEKTAIKLSFNRVKCEGYIDKQSLHYILSNLISNAVKYSPNGGIIRIELHCQNHSACFTISDEGLGIPTESIPHLFQPFYRACNVNDIIGNGLGLAIVKKFVDLYDGVIDCESNLGEGTTFRVTLPLMQKISLN